MGFRACATDSCLFVRDDKLPAIIALYVDDLLIGSATAEEADNIKMELTSHFSIKDLGDARYVLAIQVQYYREKGTLHICQSQFIERMIAKFAKNPNVVGQHLEDELHSKLTDQKRFREVIGSLLYVANAPTQAHMNTAIPVLRYLKGTQDVGIEYKRMKGQDALLQVFVDANWGGDLKSRRSTSGVLVLMCGGPVIFKAKRQRTVALSSAESEYMALSLAAQEAMWLRNLLGELGLDDLPSQQSMLTTRRLLRLLDTLDISLERNISHYAITLAVEEGILTLEYIPSAMQLADFMTNASPTPQFTKLVAESGITILAAANDS
ncbi:LOW QUALITY PROTEIN: Retrovirus-related pol Polyprotein [Phytophthora megakarya]|uniref:Retrovirus-related pol Polyprotein n=1 Tax=Phytophthora megakarya TaxID=4795 RepID=A0A225WD57_9STRA|nr:LOW QUALITY PROTEIN: Retrovirus-related pol Polyprotein [Phytophthora megakarya]